MELKQIFKAPNNLMVKYKSIKTVEFETSDGTEVNFYDVIRVKQVIGYGLLKNSCVYPLVIESGKIYPMKKYIKSTLKIIKRIVMP